MRRALQFLVPLILAVRVCAQPLFPAEDRVHMERALDALAMTPADLLFSKDHGEPKWTLGWVTNALNDPLLLVDAAERIRDAASSGERDALLRVSADLLETGPAPLPPLHSFRFDDAAPVDGCPEPLAKPLADFLNILVADTLLVRKSTEPLSGEERAYLAASSLASTFNTELNETAREVLEAAGIPRAVQLRVEEESDLLDGTAAAVAWLELMRTCDPAALHAALESCVSAASGLAAASAAVPVWPEETLRRETPWGDIVIGTTGSDRHDAPALLILDPGGDDVYTGSAGSANGLLGRELAVIIDLGGDDTYVSRGLTAPGSALFGLSVLIDAEGDDRYDADYIGTAAGVHGAAWVEELGGNDSYRAQAIAQGAGIAGFGTLIDAGGRDHYETGLYGQGFAGVMGWGVLVDRAGNDVYVAGNVRKDSDRNEDRFLSLSQGFSIGARPHAGGGVGALVDLAGNDIYNADVYGQGVSYYYSAGFLIDADGNDRYSMYQYGQGCGIHFSLALLADLSGADFYTGFILAQGAAHDYSVGMLFDHEGDDTYTADHHAQGRALNNAFALLVDRAGSDGYFGRRRDGTQGIGNEGGFRDFGSLALLLDLAGPDIYSGGFSNGMTTIRPLYGVVYDAE